MATKKISELEAINAAEDNDVLVIVDTSESTTNKITKGNLLIGAGHTIEMTLNENYQIVLVLKNAAGTALSTQTIDLPNENAVTNLVYNNGILTVTKQSGATSQINLTGLIEGLVTESDFNTFKEALQATLEAINEKDAEQDEAISENYKVINKLNEKLENQQKVIDQLPQVTGQGTSITLENTIEAQFTKFDEEGNSTQESTEGRNYLPQAEIKSVTSNGVTITSYADGKFTIKGTPTAEFFANFNFPTFDVPANAYFHLRNTGNASYNYALKILYGSTEKGAYAFSSNNKIWQMNNEAYSANLFQFFCNSNAVGTAIDITLQPSIELTDAVTDFEKDTNGASPNPNYEQPIKSAGDNIQLWGGFTFERTSSGVTFNQNSNGSITADGTATASVSSVTIAAAIEAGICKTLPAGTYIVSGGISSDLKLQVYDSDINLLATDTGYGATFTLNEEKTVVVRLTIDTNVSVDNQTFYVKLEKGNKASGYSPYGMGSINEKIGNANILDTSKVKSVKNQTGDNRTGYYCKIPKTGRYLLLLNTTNTMYFGKSSDINASTTLIGSTNSSFSTNYDFNAGEYFVIWGTKTDTDKLMVKLADGQTDYIPHKEQDYSIFVQKPMRSIGDVRDKFVKKIDGWYERHYIARYICKGNEVFLNQTVLETVSRWVIQMIGAKTGSALSNYYTYYANYTASTEHFYVSSNQILTFHNKTITSSSQYLQYFAEKYASGNPVYFDYQLATPLDLPCTETQIQQLENLPSTYKDFTYVVSEDETEAYLEVSGIRDINTMFDKVTNAIISLGGNV